MQAYYPPPTFSYTDNDSKTILHLRRGEDHDATAPKSSQFYDDVHFNIRVKHTGRPAGNPEPTRKARKKKKSAASSTVVSEAAAAMMEDYGFHLDWSGFEPPPELPSSFATDSASSGSEPRSASSGDPSFPSAKSLSDPEAQKLMQDALSMLDRFLTANPHKRDLEINSDAIPGPDRTVLVYTDDTEVTLNRIFLQRHVCLANKLLQLLQEAAAWEAEQCQDQDRTWPLPFKRPFHISSECPSNLPPPTGPSNGSLDEILDRIGPAVAGEKKRGAKLLSSRPDYYLIYGGEDMVSMPSSSHSYSTDFTRESSSSDESDLEQSDSSHHRDSTHANAAPPVIVGTIESKPHLRPEDLLEYVQARRDPLDPASSSDSPAVASRRRDLSNALSSTSSARVPADSSSRGQRQESSNANFRGFNLRTWSQKVSMQLSSHSFLHNTVAGLLVAHGGFMLLPFELHSLLASTTPATEAPARLPYALCFAKEALYSFVPGRTAIPGTPEDPEWFVRHLPTVPRSQPASSQSSVVTTQPANRFAFRARPGTVWGLVHWSLLTWSVKQAQSLQSGSAAEEVDALADAVEVVTLLPPVPDRAGRRRSLRRGGGGNVPDSSQIDPARRGLRITPALFSSIGFLPVIGALAVFPAPLAYGLHANVYQCMPAPPRRSPGWSRRVIEGRAKTTRACWPSTAPSASLVGAQMVVKVHRAPLPDPEKGDEGGHRYAPPLRTLQPGEWYDWSSVEGVALLRGVKARTQCELVAYTRLRSLQGSALPKLVGVAPPLFAPKSLSWKLVLEHVGASLGSIAEHWPALYVKWERDIRAQVIAAVKACHALGVVHTDLHASNIVASWSKCERDVEFERDRSEVSGQRRMAFRACSPCSPVLRTAKDQVRRGSADQPRRSIDSGISLPASQTSNEAGSPLTSLTHSFEALSLSPVGEVAPASYRSPGSSEGSLRDGPWGGRPRRAEPPKRKLRVALIDWSSARVFRVGTTPPPEVLADELESVTETLDDLLDWAADNM